MAIPFRCRGEPRFCFYHETCFYQLPQFEIKEKLSSGLVVYQTNHSPLTMTLHHFFPDHVDPTRPAERQVTPKPYRNLAACKFCDKAIHPGTYRMAIPYRCRGEPRFCFYHETCFYQLPQFEIEEKLSSGLLVLCSPTQESLDYASV